MKNTTKTSGTKRMLCKTNISCLAAHLFMASNFLSPCFIYGANLRTEEVTVYNIDGKNTNKVYVDGMGNVLQTQTMVACVGASFPVVVSAIEYDESNRPVKKCKPFLYYSSSDPGFISNRGSFYANTQWNDSAYSSIQYYEDPLGRIKVTGVPGVAFCSDKSAGGHPDSVWYFGVTGNGTATAPSNYNTYFGPDGFILSSQLTVPDNLNSTIPDLLALVPEGELQDYLTVVKDRDGHFTQNITDINGKTIKTWALPDASQPANVIVSENKYDILGNISEIIPPPTLGNSVGSTKFIYNTLGQLVSKETPDAGVVNYYYDDAGNIEEIIDANCTSEGKKIVYEYDDFGRVTVIKEQNATSIGARVRKIYDDPNSVYKYIENIVGGELASYIIEELQNTYGRLVAEITYGQDLMGPLNDKYYSPFLAEISYLNKVVNMYGYDEEGRVNIQLKCVPQKPLEKITFTYDEFQGNLLSSELWIQGDQPTNTVITSYSYDPYGRLEKITRDDKPFAEYSYDGYGRMMKKTFSAASPEVEVPYTYNIRDWVTDIGKSGDKFYEHIDYNTSPATGPFNGNISHATYQTTVPNSGTVPEGAYLDLQYTYDDINRLTFVSNGYHHYPIIDDAFDASCTYYNDGRIKTKKEGLTQSLWGDYSYHLNTSTSTYTNKLEGVAASATKTGINYIYDNNGNMIYDRSKHLIITYDWRDMPVLFTAFLSEPTTPVTDKAGVLSLLHNKGMVASEVAMRYDASGNRVVKEVTEFNECVQPSAQNNGLVIMGSNQDIALAMDANGDLTTCRWTKTPPVADQLEGLVISKQGQTLMTVTEEGTVIPGSATTGIKPTIVGDLEIVYLPDQTIPNATISPVGGVVQIKGALLTSTVSSGTTYGMSGSVFTKTGNLAPYKLSYVPVGSDGVSRYTKTGTTSTHSLNFFLKDHLGSTRAAIDENGEIQEATAYLAYGKEMPLYSPSAVEKGRIKFTGKELDEDGLNKIGEIPINIQITGLPSVTEGNLIIQHGSQDASTEIPLVIANGEATLSTSLSYDFEKQFSMFEIHLFDGAQQIRADIVGVNPILNLGKGDKFSVNLNCTYADLSGNVTYCDPQSENCAGSKWNWKYKKNGSRVGKMDLVYFGKRYYDAEVGRWTAVDPIGQFVDGYMYCSVNPINLADPNGEWSIFAHFSGTTEGEFLNQISTAGSEIKSGGWGIAAGLGRGLVSPLTAVFAGFGAMIPDVFQQGPFHVWEAHADIEGGKGRNLSQVNSYLAGLKVKRDNTPEWNIFGKWWYNGKIAHTTEDIGFHAMGGKNLYIPELGTTYEKYYEGDLGKFRLGPETFYSFKIAPFYRSMIYGE